MENEVVGGVESERMFPSEIQRLRIGDLCRQGLYLFYGYGLRVFAA